MIDIEVPVFDSVYQAVSPKVTAGKFVSQQVKNATEFPCGSLVEIVNRTVRDRQTSTPIENFARVIYQLDVYGKTKKQVKEVYGLADDAMIAMGFTRTSGDYIDNAMNPDIHRRTARYEAEVDRQGTIYRIP